jgi:hypothetical protein
MYYKTDREALKRIMLKANKLNIPFDFGIISPSNIVSRYDPYTGRRTYGRKDIPKTIKSLVVYLFFTDRAFDYYVRNIFTKNLIFLMNKYFPTKKTIYDNYRIIRKEAAYYAGLGEIGRNSLLFSPKFGFNCKIDLIMTEIAFDNNEKRDKNNYLLKYCRDCSECVRKCPQDCSMRFDLIDWKKCAQFIDPKIPTPEKLCRNCIKNCKHSERICRRTLRSISYKGTNYMNLAFEYFKNKNYFRANYEAKRAMNIDPKTKKHIFFE